MKIICDRLLLSDAIAGVSKAVTQRSNLPVLEGILFKADSNELVLTGYDLEMGITTNLSAIVQEPGEVVISARLLGDMVRRLNSEAVEISTDENLATTIKGGITEFNILGMPAMDYPEPVSYTHLDVYKRQALPCPPMLTLIYTTSAPILQEGTAPCKSRKYLPSCKALFAVLG